MFTPDYIIDSVQNAKTEFVKFLVKDEKIQSSLIDFIEAQRTFAKSVAKNTAEMTALLQKNFTRTW